MTPSTNVPSAARALYRYTCMVFASSDHVDGAHGFRHGGLAVLDKRDRSFLERHHALVQRRMPQLHVGGLLDDELPYVVVEMQGFKDPGASVEAPATAVSAADAGRGTEMCLGAANAAVELQLVRLGAVGSRALRAVGAHQALGDDADQR